MLTPKLIDDYLDLITGNRNHYQLTFYQDQKHIKSHLLVNLDELVAMGYLHKVIDLYPLHAKLADIKMYGDFSHLLKDGVITYSLAYKGLWRQYIRSLL